MRTDRPMGEQRQGEGDAIRGGGWAVLLALSYFAMAVLSLTFASGPFGYAAIWGSSGIALGTLLMADRRYWAPHLLAIAAASLAANRLADGEWSTCLGFTAGNLIEPMVAAWLIRRRIPQRGRNLETGRDLIIFCASAAAAALCSGVVATLFGPWPPFLFFLSWWLSDLLGMLIIAPVVLLAVNAVRRWARDGFGLLSPLRLAEVGGLIAMVMLVAAMVFAQASYPALFLPLGAVMIAVVRLGVAGAGASVLLITAIASASTAFGTGPIMLIEAGTMERAFFLQLYLLTLFGASLPVAALLTAQQRLVEKLSGSNRMLKLAEAAAHLGHWRLDRDGGGAFWSDEVYRIHGLTPGSGAPGMDGILMYVEEDQPIIAEAVRRALSEGEPYELRLRIRRPDGTIRNVLTRAEITRGPDGSIADIFGMFQDITVQSEQERLLEAARVRAEEAAAAARIASETDPLTGLPNRRQLLNVLALALDQAGFSAQPLSIAMLDIDHFKRINDTYGHVAGDHVLQRVARVAGSGMRATDLIGRFGGEEFVMILPGTPAGLAESVAERVRIAIEDDAEAPAMTASLGVASWIPGEPATSLIHRADDALYAAKRAGRNCVRSAGQ